MVFLSKMKILTVVGARPQFIKAAVLSRALKTHSNIEEYVVHTGQHYDDNMSEIFFHELELRQADCNLNIKGSSNADTLSRMIPELEKIIRQQSPDLVLVYGDTNSTLAGALTAKMCGIKVAHVEAGMRHGNLAIPEELNRVLTDQVSDFLFCSGSVALKNLEKEGFAHKSIQLYDCGDLMIDAAKHYSEIAGEREFPLSEELKKHFVLCTIHRSENVDVKSILKELLSTIDEIATTIPVVLPLHPRTRKMMAKFGLSTQAILIDPVGYLDMLNLLRHTQMVITDSGGLQKEAYFFKKHTLLLREHTEWVELAENGYLQIVGTKKEDIITGFNQLLDKKSSFESYLYGRGDAGVKIADIVSKIIP